MWLVGYRNVTFDRLHAVFFLDNKLYIIKFENWSNKHVLEADPLNYLRTDYDIYLFNSYGNF